MLQQIVDFVFPPQCGGCDAFGIGACERCLPRNALQCVRLPTLDVVALGIYENGLRRAVLALKSGRRDVARAFAHRLGDLVRTGEMLVPVPTTAARRRERGFDGCELIARSIPHAETLLGLVQTAGDRQRGRGREARLAARGRFTWRGLPLHQRTVTLVDDVVTTGTTLEDCADVLRQCGASVERAIAIAYTSRA
jgi:competence protein ComFC